MIAREHRRRSIRLTGYDYTRPGAYFVTICSWGHECLFGEIVDGVMHTNDAGRIVASVWEGLPKHYRNMACDAFVVMPNHVHAIIMIGAAFDSPSPESPTGGVRAGFKPAPTPTNTEPMPVRAGFKPAPTPTNTEPMPVRAGFKPAPTRALSEIVRALKTFSARQINAARGTRGISVWQRNYYEHIIRNEESMRRIRSYIHENPARWAFDRENPNALEADIAKDLSELEAML